MNEGCTGTHVLMPQMQRCTSTPGLWLQNIRCTLREIRMYKLVVEATTKQLAPVSSATKKKVGQLTAHGHGASACTILSRARTHTYTHTVYAQHARLPMHIYCSYVCRMRDKPMMRCKLLPCLRRTCTIICTDRCMTSSYASVRFHSCCYFSLLAVSYTMVTGPGCPVIPTICLFYVYTVAGQPGSQALDHLCHCTHQAPQTTVFITPEGYEGEPSLQVGLCMGKTHRHIICSASNGWWSLCNWTSVWSHHI